MRFVTLHKVGRKEKASASLKFPEKRVENFLYKHSNAISSYRHLTINICSSLLVYEVLDMLRELQQDIILRILDHGYLQQ